MTTNIFKSTANLAQECRQVDRGGCVAFLFMWIRMCVWSYNIVFGRSINSHSTHYQCNSGVPGHLVSPGSVVASFVKHMLDHPGAEGTLDWRIRIRLGERCRSDAASPYPRSQKPHSGKLLVAIRSAYCGASYSAIMRSHRSFGYRNRLTAARVGGCRTHDKKCPLRENRRCGSALPSRPHGRVGRGTWHFARTPYHVSWRDAWWREAARRHRTSKRSWHDCGSAAKHNFASPNTDGARR